jgi:DNA-binding transcriptional regulator YiaG
MASDQIVAAEVLERLLGAVRNRETGPEAGQFVKTLRESLAMTPNEFAQALQVSPGTVHRWEKGDLPRMPQAQKIAGLVRSSTTSAPADQFIRLVEVDGHHFAILLWREVMERQRLAEEVWILKCNRPFLAGWPGGTRAQIIDNLMGHPSLTYKYFFPADNEQPVPAEDSFYNFKKALRDEYPTLADRVIGYGISDDADRLKFGLTPTFATSMVIRYRPDARKMLSRDHDVLIELPVAAYDRATRSLADDESLLWLELPQRQASALKFEWRKHFAHRKFAPWEPTGERKDYKEDYVPIHQY